MAQPFVPPEHNSRSPASMRGSLMLEVASELSQMRNWAYSQPLIHMRTQGTEDWAVTLFGSDSANAVPLVGRKEVTFAIVNPGAILALAVRGLGPFPEPIPLRAITVLPQFDQLGFAVNASTGLETLTDMKDQKYPLKVSLRGQRDHAQHVVIKQVLSALDMKIEDIEEWDGQLLWEPPLPDRRLESVKSGRADALWDEAMPMFASSAIEMGMRFLDLAADHRERLTDMGLRLVPLGSSLVKNDSLETLEGRFPNLPKDSMCVDFSGWIVYTHADTPDDIVEKFCMGLEVRKDRIPHYATQNVVAETPLPLQEMCSDTRDAPLYIPLHPAAKRFWSARGYL